MLMVTICQDGTGCNGGVTKEQQQSCDRMLMIAESHL